MWHTSCVCGGVVVEVLCVRSTASPVECLIFLRSPCSLSHGIFVKQTVPVELKTVNSLQLNFLHRMNKKENNEISGGKIIIWIINVAWNDCFLWSNSLCFSFTVDSLWFFQIIILWLRGNRNVFILHSSFINLLVLKNTNGKLHNCVEAGCRFICFSVRSAYVHFGAMKKENKHTTTTK